VNNLENILNELEGDSKPLRPPFGYPGGKLKMAAKILPHLPYRKTYVEPFCGSCAILLRRTKSDFEIANDMHFGIISFYKTLQMPDILDQLIERLELTVNSREEFEYCHDQVMKANLDPIEQAACFLYSMVYSFSSGGLGYSRSTTSPLCSTTLDKRLQELPDVTKRIQNVVFECGDWLQSTLEYDSPDTVYYFDPPYLGADPRYLFNRLHTEEAHRKIITTIKKLKGFVAISGYAHPLYDDETFWTDRIEWKQNVSICRTERSTVKEVLWIKE